MGRAEEAEVSRKCAARCSKCGKPFRIGDWTMIESWGDTGPVVDGRRTVKEVLRVELHARCLPEWMREKRDRKKAKHD